MTGYLEAMLLLLPPEAGGRSLPIAPREASYRPFARFGAGLSRVRVIEGPPLLAPGEEARVVVEIESDVDVVYSGNEIRLFEHDAQPVALLTVVRVCRGAIPA